MLVLLFVRVGGLLVRFRGRGFRGGCRIRFGDGGGWGL